MLSPIQQAALNINAKYQGKTLPSALKTGLFDKLANIGPNIADKVIGAFQGGINTAAQGVENAAQAKNPIQFGEGLLKGASGVVSSLSSPLAPIFKPANDVINTIGNKIAENPQVQQFANSPAGQATSRVAEDLSNAGNIAGALLGAKGATEGFNNYAGGINLQDIHPIFKRATPIMNPDEVTIAQSKFNEAQTNLTTAQQAREAATVPAVQGTGQVSEGIGQAKDILSQKFTQPIIKLKTENPNLVSQLSQNQLEQLNGIRESAKFSLPEELNTEGSQINIGGKGTTLGNVSPEIQAQLAKAGQQTAITVDPVQAQNLMTRLNGLARQANAAGDLKINQQVIGIRDELANQFSKDFGQTWNNAYSGYAKGITAVNDLTDLVNGKGNLSEIKNAILKLGKTPEDKLILKQAVEQVKQETGIDLHDPVKAIHQVLDKELALEEAQGQSKIAQKGLEAAQKNAATEAAKPGYIKRVGNQMAAYGPRYILMRTLFKLISGL